MARAAANPPPDPGGWAAIEDPATRSETALRELYAYYRGTRRAYENLLPDEELVPVVKRLMTGYHEYLRAVQEVLLAGRAAARRAAPARRSGSHSRSDLAHAGPGAGTGPRRGRRPDVPARRRVGQSAIRTLTRRSELGFRTRSPADERIRQVVREADITAICGRSGPFWP